MIEPAGLSVPPATEGRPFTVTELVSALSDSIGSQFADLLVSGELLSFKQQAVSGHCYFTLGDQRSALDCVMWKSRAEGLTFEPEAGDEVLCRGYVGVYSKQGRMQLYVSSLRPVGEGAATRAFEALKKKLAAEGLFDEGRKRPLPFVPAVVGVVTSTEGAAVRDIASTLRRRFPACRIVVSPAQVQGSGAATSLVDALVSLSEAGQPDVVIIARGGGAPEDLAAFNTERVVRAIAGCPVPVVSGVGHESDVTLADMVADLRASTPTAAAEAVVPVRSELVEDVSVLEARLVRAVTRGLERHRLHVGHAGARLRRPEALLGRTRQRVDELMTGLERGLVDSYRTARERFAATRSKLDALSPLAVLERGYAIVRLADGRAVRDAALLVEGQGIGLSFARGSARAEITEVASAKGGSKE